MSPTDVKHVWQTPYAVRARGIFPFRRYDVCFKGEVLASVNHQSTANSVVELSNAAFNMGVMHKLESASIEA